MPSAYRDYKPHCEQCGWETEYLFAGVVTAKATRYSRGVGGRSRSRAIGVVDVQRDGMVCMRCRPPSDLEIKEMLSESSRRTIRRQLKTF